MSLAHLKSQQASKISQKPFIILLFLISITLLFSYPNQSLPISQNPLAINAFDSLEHKLSFTPTDYQFADSSFEFQSHTTIGNYFFGLDEIMIVLPTVDPQTASINVSLHYNKTDPNVQISGTEKLRGTVSYFFGQNPDQWLTNLPTFSEIVYTSIYSGIDLYYEGVDGDLKSTYIVSAGANPRDIRWSYRGAETVSIDPRTGNLNITLSSSGEMLNSPQLTEHAPIAYQTIDGKQNSVPIRFDIASDGAVGFVTGKYNQNYPLIIDPILEFSTYLGGDDFDEINDIAIDDNGDIYVTGSTSSTNFPTVDPLYDDNEGLRDVFVTKFSSNGELLYSTYIGGDNIDIGFGIDVDTVGNAYVTGSAGIVPIGTDFPTTPGAFAQTDSLGVNGFVFKLNPTGDQLLYSTFIDGTGGPVVQGFDIAVDDTGNAYIVGETRATAFPTKNAFQPTFGGGINDAFIVKLNSAGSDLVYASYFGGEGHDTVLENRANARIAIDSSGNAYIASTTDSPDLVTTIGAFDRVLDGGTDGYIAKINADGDEIIYSTFLGGSSEGIEMLYDLVVNNTNEVYVTGTTSSSDFPVKNPLQDSLIGGADIFITRLNTTGTDLIYSTFIGGAVGEFGFGITLDDSENIYVTGNSSSFDFPTKNPLQSDLGGGGFDAIVMKLNPDGSSLIYSTFFGGSGHEEGRSIVTDSVGNSFIVGQTRSGDLQTINSAQPDFGGLADGFVTKISPSNFIFLPLIRG